VIPPEPLLGDPLPVPSPSPDMLERMARRRSAPAQALGEPGPTPEQVRDLIRLGARVPDHGKLAPWRFVVIERPAKDVLVDRLRTLSAAQPDPDKALAKLAKLAAAPVTLLVISRTTPGHKVPEWEQALSSGAVCMALLQGAHALGFGANWITDWYAYAPEALALLGVGAGEKVAGFIHLGTPAEPPLERARPDAAALTTVWRPAY